MFVYESHLENIERNYINTTIYFLNSINNNYIINPDVDFSNN